MISKEIILRSQKGPDKGKTIINCCKCGNVIMVIEKFNESLKIESKCQNCKALQIVSIRKEYIIKIIPLKK